MAVWHARAAGLLLGIALDEIFGDPRRWHPVAGYGRYATAVEARLYRDSRTAGVGYAAAMTLPLVAAATLAGPHLRTRPRLATLATALATWSVLGGRSLRRAGSAMAARLDANDVEGARELIPTLCGRDPDSLDSAGITRATVESIAENTSDAVVAPLLWGSVGGLAGLLGYRAVNTLDAMVGHRSPRYAKFGTASARLDDVANWLPARVCAALTVAGARLCGGSAAGGLRAWKADAARHPSPNAGRCEAALAGVLGITLGGATVYAGRIEDRPLLGSGRAPVPADIRRAVRMSRLVQYGAAALAVSVLAARGAR